MCLGILNFDCANLNFAALSLTVILEVFNTLIELIFSVVYATITVGVSGSQRGDNFRANDIMDHVLIGPFAITAVSQYLWAWMGGRARTMD